MKITKITMPNCPKCRSIQHSWEEFKQKYPEIKTLETDISNDNSIIFEMQEANVFRVPCFKLEVNNDKIFNANISGLKDLEQFIEENKDE